MVRKKGQDIKEVEIRKEFRDADEIHNGPVHGNAHLCSVI